MPMLLVPPEPRAIGRWRSAHDTPQGSPEGRQRAIVALLRDCVEPIIRGLEQLACAAYALTLEPVRRREIHALSRAPLKGAFAQGGPFCKRLHVERLHKAFPRPVYASALSRACHPAPAAWLDVRPRRAGLEPGDLVTLSRDRSAQLRHLHQQPQHQVLQLSRRQMVEISRRRHGHLESDSRLLGNLIILPPQLLPLLPIFPTGTHRMPTGKCPSSRLLDSRLSTSYK